VRLIELSVKKWRSFRNEVNLKFDDPITVISGPNECGKSTLIEAAVRGLFDRHTAGGQAVESLRPWGSSLAPEVCVTFTARGECYRIKKRFLDQPLSELSQLINGKWEPIAEGDAADRRVLELIGGELPRSGLSRSNHHGIVQALWVPQGSAEFPRGWNAEVTDALEAVLGTVTQTAETTALEQQIHNEHHQRLTAAQGKPRANSELDNAIKELQEVEEDYNEIREQHQELEEKIQDLKGRLQDIRQIEEEYDKARKCLQDIKEQVEEAEKHKELRLRMENQFKQAQNDYITLSKQVKAIQDAKEAIEKAQEKRDTLETKQKQLESDINQERAAQEKLTKELREKRSERSRIESEASIIHDVLRARDLKQQIDDFRKDLDTAENTRNEIREINERMATSVYPSDADVKNARELDRKVRDGEATLQAQGLTLQISGKQQVTAQVTLDDHPLETIALDKDGSRQFHAGTKIQVELPELISFTVTSGSDQAREALEALEQNREELRDLLAQFSVTCLDELEEKQRERQAYENKLNSLQERLEHLRLQGDTEKLHRKIRSLENELSAVEERLQQTQVKPEWKIQSSEYLQETLEELQQQLKDLDRDIKDLEGKISTDRVNKLSDELKTIETKIARVDQTIKEKQDDLKKLRDEDDYDSDEARDKVLSKLAAKLEEKKRAYEVFENEKEEKEDQPKKRHDILSKRVEFLQKQLNDAKLEAAKIQGALVDTGGLDIHQKEGNLEARLNSLKQKVERLNRDAQAWKLLDSLVTDHKKEQIQSLAAPVKHQVDAWLTRVTGPIYTGLEFSDELIPVGVRVYPWDIQAPLGELSYGTQEQLNVLVRLAIGWVISQHEPQVVVLDDRLVNTDPGRLDELRFILQEASEKVQLILLTCHPSRYSGITENFINLRDLRSSSTPY